MDFNKLKAMDGLQRIYLFIFLVSIILKKYCKNNFNLKNAVIVA